MPLPRFVTLFPNNTQVIQVLGLSDILTSQYLNNATVTATLLNARGQNDPVLQNISLGYITASNGNYAGVVPQSFNPPEFVGEKLNGYQLVITAEQAGVGLEFTIQAIIQLRNES